MDESITKELRLWASDSGFTSRHEIFRIADRIDARFDREPTAKQDEVDGLKADNAKLQTKLDASIPVPVDADGVPWTCADVDKPFSLTDGDKATEGTVREIAYAWPLEGWWIVDQYDTHYPADRCRHVAPEPPETIEDVRKSCDSTVSYLASVSGMGWHDVEAFSKDVHKQLDRAYSCGKRDGAGIEASRLHHVAPEPPEPPDSQERIDADAGTIEDDMLDGAFEYCMDHGIEVTTDSADSYIYARAYGDLLRRQRELDGRGEQE